MPVEKGQVAVYKVFGPREGKFGEFYNHWFKLEDQEGGFSFPYKDDRHRAKEGDSISFQYQQNGQYKNVDAKSLEVTGGGAGETGKHFSFAKNGPSEDRQGSNFSENRQDSIMRQSAMGYAATLVASHSDVGPTMDELASEVLRIADEYFLPYAKHGRTEQKERKLEEDNNRARQAASDEADFDDPIDF